MKTYPFRLPFQVMLDAFTVCDDDDIPLPQFEIIFDREHCSWQQIPLIPLSECVRYG